MVPALLAGWRIFRGSGFWWGLLWCWRADLDYSHGRDGKLHIWQLREEDEEGMNKTLPIDDAVTERKKPWLLHTLLVNAVNFCSFTSLPIPSNENATLDSNRAGADDLLIATPGVQDGTVTLTSFPSETRVGTVPPPQDVNTGMLMAIGLYHSYDRDGTSRLGVVGGYESGHAAVFARNKDGKWEGVYVCKAHSQPVLSVGVLPPAAGKKAVAGSSEAGCFFTSSADAVVARHTLPSPTDPRPDSSDVKTLQTRHAGQQSLVLRSDNVVFATAGWDGRARVYDVKGMREMAVLKWHKEGCYAVDFARVFGAWEGEGAQGEDEGAGGREGIEGKAEMVKRDLTVKERRVQRTRETHWVAVGCKDGKVSLWEVY